MPEPPTRGYAAFALAEGGCLYGLDGAAWQWEYVADIGTRHQRIAVDCGFLYGVNEGLGVDFQRLKGASVNGWKGLARGHMISIAVWGGTVFGVGRAEGGDRIYRLERTGGMSGRPWECAAGGRTFAVTAAGDRLYISGMNGWLYTQHLSDLSESSKWEKALNAGCMLASFVVLREDLVLALGQDGEVLLLDGASSSWRPGPEQGLPARLVSLAAAGVGAPVVSAAEASAAEAPPSCPAVLALPNGLAEEAPPPAECRPEDCGAEAPVVSDSRPLPTPARAFAERGDERSPGRGRPAAAAAGGSHEAREEAAASRSEPVPCSSLRVGDQALLSRAVQALGEGYLILEAGECVEVLYIGSEEDESERDWLFCRALGDGRAAARGWIPRAAVAPALEQTLEEARPPPARGPALVCRSVAAPGDGYLALAEGERVEIAYVGSEASEDDGWLYGRNATGQGGWFPAWAVG